MGWRGGSLEPHEPPLDTPLLSRHRSFDFRLSVLHVLRDSIATVPAS